VAALPIIESADPPPGFAAGAPVRQYCGEPPRNVSRLTRRFHVAGVCVTFGLALAACGKKPPPPMPPPTVGYVVLRAQPVAVIADLPGRVAAFESSDVRPQVNGVVRQRTFIEGSTVRAGQILYVIEDSPFRAAVLNAEGLLAQAEANIRSTQLQAERFQRLVVVNGVSKQDADNAQAAAAQAKALALAQRGVLNSAQVNLGFTRIRAPISGRIGRSLFTPGALVQAGQTNALATIQRMDHVYVDVTQSAADLLNLRAAALSGAVSQSGPGTARVQLILPNGALYPIEGAMRFADVTVDPTTGAVDVRADFPNPNGDLLPNLYVRARLVQGVRMQGLLAPQTGISHNERGEATALLLGPGNVVVQRIVKTDRAVGNQWVVTDGLTPGDKLIVDGLLNLHPGAKVNARAFPAGS
jgi:membrane fusion protein, multidrug efflux system